MSMKISPDLDCILWLHALSQVVGKSAYGIMAALRRASDKYLRFSRLMCKFWSHKILGSYNLCNAFPVAAYFCNHFQGSLFLGVLNLRGSRNVLEKFWKRGVHDSGLGTLWMKFHIWNWCLDRTAPSQSSMKPLQKPALFNPVWQLESYRKVHYL